MPLEAAQAVFAAIFCAAILVWAVSLRKASWIGREAEKQRNPWGMDSSMSPGWASQKSSPENPWAASSMSATSEAPVVAGQQTVPGRPEDVSRAIADRIAQTTVPGRFSGLFEVTEQTRDRVSVRKTGSLVCNQPSGLYFSEADFELKDTGHGTVEVKYSIGFERLGQGLRKICLALILGLGLPVLLVLATVLWVFVVNSDNLHIRWQVFQGLQVVHVLWPPFLIMRLYRTGKTHARTFVSNLLRSIQPDRVPQTAFVDGR